MRKTVKILKAISDSNRLRILKMLEIRTLCVCEITEILQLATSSVSKHLSLLRDAELILDEKNGKWVDYSLHSTSDDEDVQRIIKLVSEFVNDDKAILQDKAKVSQSDRNIICGIETIN